MASVGISALGRTSIQFVDPGVKVNGDYYSNVLLRQGLLSEMREQKKCIGLVFWNTANFVRFSVIHVLQGSVATYVRCGGMSTTHCIGNFLLSLAVKEFLKSVKIWQSYGQNLGASFFLEHGVFVVSTKRIKCHAVASEFRYVLFWLHYYEVIEFRHISSPSIFQLYFPPDSAADFVIVIFEVLHVKLVYAAWRI